MAQGAAAGKPWRKANDEQLHLSSAALAMPPMAVVTIHLTVMATPGGLTIGIFGAAIRSGRATWFSWIQRYA